MLLGQHCSMLSTILFDIVTPDRGLIQAQQYCSILSQYSEWTVGPLSSVTCALMFMQFTGFHQPIQGFYWPENAILTG